MPSLFLALLLTAAPTEDDELWIWLDVVEHHMPALAVPMFCELVDGEIEDLLQLAEEDSESGALSQVMELRVEKAELCGGVDWSEGDEGDYRVAPGALEDYSDSGGQ